MPHRAAEVEPDDIEMASDTASIRGILRPASIQLSNSLIELLPNDDDEEAYSDLEDEETGQVPRPGRTALCMHMISISLFIQTIADPSYGTIYWELYRSCLPARTFHAGVEEDHGHGQDVNIFQRYILE